MASWHIACTKHIGCNPSSFKCQHSLRNHTFLNDYCPVEPPNTTLFDFGIFLNALQSGTVASKDFPRKFAYCFWWGLRNLRFAHTPQWFLSVLVINKHVMLLENSNIPRREKFQYIIRR